MEVVPAQAEIAARFGDNLTRCRKRAGLSQDALSLGASLHRTEISQLERGMRVPRIDTLVKLAASMGIAVDELLDGITWKPGSIQTGAFKLRPPLT